MIECCGECMFYVQRGEPYAGDLDYMQMYHAEHVIAGVRQIVGVEPGEIILSGSGQWTKPSSSGA
jgi:hypothetical protein